MTPDQARIVLLENALVQAHYKITFLHDCLTKDGYHYAHPDQTFSYLKEVGALVTIPPLCHHSRTRSDCPSCVSGRERRLRMIQARQTLERADLAQHEYPAGAVKDDDPSADVWSDPVEHHPPVAGFRCRHCKTQAVRHPRLSNIWLCPKCGFRTWCVSVYFERISEQEQPSPQENNSMSLYLWKVTGSFSTGTEAHSYFIVAETGLSAVQSLASRAAGRMLMPHDPTGTVCFTLKADPVVRISEINTVPGILLQVKAQDPTGALEAQPELGPHVREALVAGTGYLVRVWRKEPRHCQKVGIFPDIAATKNAVADFVRNQALSALDVLEVSKIGPLLPGHYDFETGVSYDRFGRMCEITNLNRHEWELENTGWNEASETPERKHRTPTVMSDPPARNEDF